MAHKKDSLHLVDRELRPILEVFTGFDVSTDALPMLRAIPAAPALEKPAYKEVIIKRGSGDDLKLLIIDPHSGTAEHERPALLYIHGGGFVFGTPETILPTMQRLAKDVGCVIVLPAYRLAPEHPFPAALDDNYFALSWMHEQASALAIDASRIAIGGDSAGGGHAAVLSLQACDRGEYLPVFQMLLYPMLDDRTGSINLASPNTGEYIWTAENNVFGWSAYLGCPAGSAVVPKGAVPARAEDLSALPAALIATGNLDLFAQESIDYGKRLAAQGISVELEVFEGAYHGFNVMLPETKIAQRFHDTCVKSLKAAFKL